MKLLGPVLAAVVTSTPLLAAGSAAAGPLADALARHDQRDVAALRDQRDDIGARCTLGAVYAKRRDLMRAALYLEGCTEATLPDEVGPEVRRIARDVKKRVRDSNLAQIVIDAPDGMTGEIDALPGDSFTTPATLYLAPGDYTVRAHKDGLVLSNVVHAVRRSRGVVVLEPPRTVQKPGPKQVEFNVDPGAEPAHVGQPPDVKHENMMPDKYRRGMAAVANATPLDDIADPLAVRERPRTPRPYWLGLRLGGGMFDDGAASARAGIAIAGAARFPLSPGGRPFLAARLDWSRRGGASAIDALGASAGIGATVIDDRTLGIALLAQVRGELRLSDTRTLDTMTVPVSRTGVAVAAGAEVALPRTPFTAGLRFEQGLTELVPGARDRAVLFEIGVDWR